ncbi:hypothetical protein WJT74_11950 [Sphingomicrobium sp. XHP0239]|uniref:hypothetical protein n=1 Tax=Sphingomicrobium maritimum TaxID=3133972 RepID=UPI0031CC3ACC
MRNRVPALPNGGRPIPDFTPVPRRRERHDGWTPARQRAFIDALADLGSVKHACARINMTTVGAYHLRRQPGAEEFRAAWAAALDHGVQNLSDIAVARAIDGVEEVIVKDGEVVATRRRYNDRLLMFVLRHHWPEKYGELRSLHPGTRSWQFDSVESEDAVRHARENIARKLDLLAARGKADELARIAPDPAKRAAYELLYGKQDWESAAERNESGAKRASLCKSRRDTADGSDKGGTRSESPDGRKATGSGRPDPATHDPETERPTDHPACRIEAHQARALNGGKPMGDYRDADGPELQRRGFEPVPGESVVRIRRL